jgi:CheY-like chemotaxis protein
VELWLPISDRPAQDLDRPAMSAVNGCSCRVLLVDDDPLIVEATAELLRDLGHAVVESPTAQQGLELLERGLQVDLVLTDHAMPVMTGTEFARRIRARWPDLPIILATGYADLPNGEDPGLPRLSKPYQQEELAAMINRALGLVSTAAKVIPFGIARRA